MTEPRRRRTLTPFESELRFDQPLRPAAPSRFTRLRRRLGRRKERRPPTTLRGAIAHAVVRLLVMVAVATGIAVLLDHLTGRQAAFGFYVVGAFVLLAGFFLSSADMGTPYYHRRGEREQRVRLSFSYVLAGFVILAVAVAVDALAN